MERTNRKGFFRNPVFLQFIGGLIYFLFIAAGIFAYNTFAHETTHREIAKHNGCIEWEIQYHLTEPSFFGCLERDESRRLYNAEEYLADSFNEVVGYNVTSVVLTMLACTWFLFVTRLPSSKNDVSGNNKP